MLESKVGWKDCITIFEGVFVYLFVSKAAGGGVG